MTFPAAAREQLANSQLRANLRNATRTIRARRAEAIGELDDWEGLRARAAAVRDETLARLDVHLERLEDSVQRAGGHVHWARDAGEACRTVIEIARAHGATEAVKVKSLTTDEIELNQALAGAGIEPVETDLAEMIVQLGDDSPSHILVPAIHRNRAEIRDLFARTLGLPELSDDPRELTRAARSYLRERFLRAPMAISGANFAVAETGTVCVVESEGNGRMCLTLPPLLVTVMGIDKTIATWNDLAILLELLPRSSTGERMNPYTSLWTGVTPGDGPAEFHLVLLDAGRADVLADPVGRQTLRCIRCSACLNICPVYERVGGHAYESVYPGPIGAILTPQLQRERATDLPHASSLCGACYDVCPVAIDIPSVLLHLRARAVRGAPHRRLAAEPHAMRLMAAAFATRRRYELAQRAGRAGSGPMRLGAGLRPLSAWSATRELPDVPAETFRAWWRSRR
jgi:L-lactate dehydrogenase complex protein LldF